MGAAESKALRGQSNIKGLSSLKPSSGSSKSNSEHSANYKWLGDRMFTDSAYLLPVDAQELDRIRLRFRLKLALLGGHILAPIDIKLKSGKNCSFLDIGCGSGDWCTEVAKKYSNVDVLGIDIINSVLELEQRENCRFEVVNALKWPLPFNDNTYDLINIDNFLMSLKISQTDGFISEIMRLLKPGGYLQWIEIDMKAWNGGPATNELFQCYNQIMELRDMDPHLALNYEKMIKDKGFINVKHTFVSNPYGSWAGLIGELSIKILEESFRSIEMLYCSVYGWRAEDYYIKVEQALAEMEEFKGYQNLHVVACAKPLLI